MLGVEPPTFGLGGQNSTTRPTWQVILKGVKSFCSTKHVQSFAISQWAVILPIWKNSVMLYWFSKTRRLKHPAGIWGGFK